MPSSFASSRRAPLRCARPAGLIAAAGIAASIGAAASGAQITSNWLSAASGTWNVATNWSTDPAFPNNGADTYIAVISATGAPYTVTLNSSVTLDELTLNSVDALLNHTTGTFNPGTASLMAGVYRLSGGTAVGTWNVSGGQFQLSTSGGTIASTTMNGDILAAAAGARAFVSGAVSFDALRLQNNGNAVSFAPGASFTGDIITEGAAAGQRNIEMNGNNGAVTIGNGSSIVLASGAGGDFNVGGPVIFGGTMTLTNNGTIEASAAARTMFVQPGGGFTNNGTLRVTNGTLTYAGATSWTNAGTVEVSGGVLNLGNFNVTGGIGTWNRTGGTVNITGTINNAGGVINLNTSTGSWNLSNGTLTGGTVNFANGTSIGLTGSGGTIANTTINGDLIAAGASARAILSGAVSFDALRLQNNANVLGFAPGASFTGDIITEGAAAGQRNIEMNGNSGAVTIGNGSSVVLASGAGGDFNVGGPALFGGTMTLTNNGTIEANAAGRTMFVQPGGGLTNNGTLRVTNGTLTYTSAGSWTNPGTVEVSGGVLNLGNFNVTGGIGTWNRTGGTVNITGTINNAGNTILLNTSTGSWNLSNGTLTGGTVNFANGTSIGLTGNGGTIANTTINGDLIAAGASARAILSGAVSFDALRLQNNANVVGFVPGASFTGDIITEGGAAGQRNMEMNGNSGAVTIGNGSSVVLASGAGGDFNVGGPALFGGNMTLTNNGTIEANAAGRTMFVQPGGGLTNNGTLRVTNGTMTYAGAGSWTNPGTVEVSGGVLNLGNFNVTSGIGTWNRTGGTVNITGTINNAGNTILLNSSTGSWSLSNGTLTGGTVNFANGTSIGLTGSGGTLSNTTINGDLIAAGASARAILSGAVSFDALRLQNNANVIGFAPGASFTGDIITEGATAGQRNIEMNGASGAVTIGNGSSVVLASGAGGDFNVGGPVLFGGNMTLTNNGTIEASAAGRTMFVQPGGGLTNNGTVRVTNGTMTYAGATSWTNPGTVEVSGGVLNLGNFNVTGGIGTWNRTGGTVNITGAINNAASTITLNSSTGSWSLSGGSLSGGTINFANGTSIGLTGGGGTIANTSINGDVIAAGASARAILSGAVSFNALRLQNNANVIGFAPGASFAGDIIAEGATAGQRNMEMNGTNGAVTINNGSSVVLASGAGGDFNVGGPILFGGTMTLTNNGVIENNAVGRTMTVQPGGGFTNNGTLRAHAGTVAVDVGGTSAWTNDGDAIAGPGGTLRFVDGYAIGAGSSLSVEIGGALAANYGRINITAPTSIDGADIDLDFVNGFTPDWGDKFTILTFDSGEVTGDFSSFVLPALADAVNWRWFTEQTLTSVAVGVRHTSDVNRDNFINFADVNTIVSNFNAPGTPQMGDVNEDGFVNFADLNQAIAFFNTSAPPNLVPAPGAALALLGALACARRRRNA